MVCWILLADAAHARIFSTPGNLERLKLEWDKPNPAGRARAQELVTDLPGRYAKGGKMGMRSAMEPDTPPHRVEEQKFAREVADYLKAGLNRKAYDWLAIFAPAQFLGILREDLDKGVAKKVTISGAKDYSAIQEHDLPRHLAPLVEWPPA
jgi:protein required for attachment to host cells